MRVVRRRTRDLRPLGAVDPRALKLPAPRVRELALIRAWRDVAGESIARRAAVTLSRGVLEIAVADERWHRTLHELLPGIAARLAARHPALGVRSLRVRLAAAGDEADTTTEWTLSGIAVPAEPAPAPSPPARAATAGSVETASPLSIEERLAGLAARYEAARRHD
jgi:hypothetical protein